MFVGDNLLCKGLIWFMLFLLACAAYAFCVDARRPNDDPEKRNFHFDAIFLSLITWPFIPLAFIMISILRVFIYMVFLAFFAIALIAIRKPFIFIWLKRIATNIGNALLEANTLLIKIVFGKQ